MNMSFAESPNNAQVRTFNEQIGNSDLNNDLHPTSITAASIDTAA